MCMADGSMRIARWNSNFASASIQFEHSVALLSYMNNSHVIYTISYHQSLCVNKFLVGALYDQCLVRGEF